MPRDITIGALAFGLAFLPSISIVVILALPSHKSKPKSSVYRDRDGTSTADLTSKSTAWAQKILCLACSLLGLIISIIFAALDIKFRHYQPTTMPLWLVSGQWGLLYFQVLAAITTQDVVKRFYIGLFSAISSVILLGGFFYRDLLAEQEFYYASTHSRAFHSLEVVQVLLALLSMCVHLSWPRRPPVFHNGSVVDGQFTVSAFTRYTHGWVNPLLKIARKTLRLEFEDLPVMDRSTRTQNLIATWETPEGPSSFGLRLIYKHRWNFLSQVIWTVLHSFVSFAPQYANLRFLRVLEYHTPGGTTNVGVWVWIIGLAIALTGASWLEQWTFWISWSKLAVPIRAQISTLVFRKAMRCKDVKGTAQAKVEHSESRSMLGQKAAIQSQETRATVNLIGVDSKRISDFCAVNNLLLGSFSKFIIATAFLWTMLGGKAVLSGYAVLPIVLPFNYIMGKRYHKANHKLMKLRDEKLAVVTEALHGIRQIKFSAQEANWHDKIDRLRQQELAQLWKLYQYNTGMIFCYISSPIAVAATSLSVFSYLNNGLDPATAFTALAVFENLELALSIVPDALTRMLQARESTKRVGSYLDSHELSPYTQDAKGIAFENASMAWPEEARDGDSTGRYMLRNISLEFPQGELSVIAGRTGSGKSLLLAAILGEVDLLAGTIYVPCKPKFEQYQDNLATPENWITSGSIAFVNQVPWLENTSLRENILFGLPFDEARYWKVIDACALRKDIDMFADGEWTDIGSKGINLSGGQKWRVTLARALYSRAGTLLLDDIFSAVDAHVGRHIFENALTGELGRGRTRILVTHHVDLCKNKARYFVKLGNGVVEHAENQPELMRSTESVDPLTHKSEQNPSFDEHSTAVNSEGSEFETSVASNQVLPMNARKFVEEEFREIGHVKFEYYLAYMKSSGGWLFWLPALLIFVAKESVEIGQSWWIKHWTAQTASPIDALLYLAQMYSIQLPIDIARVTDTTELSGNAHDLKYYLGIYIAISALLALVGTLQFFYVYAGSLRASRNLFDELSKTVLRAPLRWLDTVPSGRILTRFTSDFDTMDSSLAWNASQFGVACCSLVGVIIAGMFVSPWVIVLAAVVVGISVYYSLYYLPGAREVKRLESKMKSPIIEIFEASLLGLSTIRAFSKVPDYISRMERQVDRQTACSWYISVTNRWIGTRTALIGNIFTLVVAVFVVIYPISLSLAAFALNFASQYGVNVAMLVRQYTNMELDMNSTERVIEYTTIPTETLDGADPPAAWPFHGRLTFSDLVVAYAPDLPPVLKGLSFSVEDRERIGIVGRTGAGKSSLMLALFRFLDAREGSIHIDGIDISTIKLQTLRSRVAIIPQDPTLFAGTIRYNLDPFAERSDLELRDALERVHLVSSSEFVVTPPGGAATPILNEHHLSDLPESSDGSNQNIFASLSSKIAAGGMNLSQGQRQLLCLARAVVSRPKIMVLDEATSAVDVETDTLIQRSIREDFADATLLVIAHRLSTIADFDKILVLDDGRAVEFGNPQDLIQLKDGVFRGMVEDSGDSEKIFETLNGNR